VTKSFDFVAESFNAQTLLTTQYSSAHPLTHITSMFSRRPAAKKGLFHLTAKNDISVGSKQLLLNFADLIQMWKTLEKPKHNNWNCNRIFHAKR